MDPQPQPESRPVSNWKLVWGLASIIVGLVGWTIGDGQSFGVNPPIPDNAKLAVVLIGWLYIIDGVRMWRGHRSYMRYIYRWGFYVIFAASAVAMVIWIYETLSLKALVAIGLAAAIALLVFILRELRKSRS